MVMGQLRPRLDDFVVGPQDVGIGSHPLPYGFGPGVRSGGRRPHQVALGEYADHRAGVGHHHRADLMAVHHRGGLGQGRISGAGHGRGRHEFTNSGGHLLSLSSWRHNSGRHGCPRGVSSSVSGSLSLLSSVDAGPCFVNVDQVNITG